MSKRKSTGSLARIDGKITYHHWSKSSVEKAKARSIMEGTELPNWIMLIDICLQMGYRTWATKGSHYGRYVLIRAEGGGKEVKVRFGRYEPSRDCDCD